jgi:uncharacterized coiled-coil DUF342 family protein
VTATPEKILDSEIRILREMIELARSLSGSESLEVETVQAAVERRSAHLASLERLENEAAGFREANNGIPASLKPLADELRRLAEELQIEERAASERLKTALFDLRLETTELVKGQRGLQSYGGPVSHLSRFTDRKG